jgi:hypothetical protein
MITVKQSQRQREERERGRESHGMAPADVG